MPPRGALAHTAIALLLALAAAAAPAEAQDRTLSWPAVSVTAHLDSAGTLTVRERQTIRFTGDWNGGERSFDLRPGQTLDLLFMGRAESDTGAATFLAYDDALDDVDEYAWADGRRALRWRARRPDDPPFAGELRHYQIDVAYGRILVPQADGSYLLDHNFAMVDRDGAIDRFTLTLTLDPAWRAPDGFTGRFEATALQPGEGWLVSIPLRYTAAGRPADVRFGTPAPPRRLILAIVVAAIVAFFLRLARRERALGRFADGPPPGEITSAWLGEHVLAMPPEVVGAAWDDHTAAPEVAAILARMVQERKLESDVKTEKVWRFAREILHLRLLVPRGSLQPHERALIDALFDSGSDRTDTDRVRARYKKTGFDPASTVREFLTTRVSRVAPGGTKPSKRLTALLLLGAIVLLGLGITRDTADAPVAFAALGISLPIFIFTVIVAAVSQRAATRFDKVLVVLALPIAVGVGLLAFILLLSTAHPVGPLTLAGLGAWTLALANSACNLAASRHSAEGIALRQRLFAARRFFRDELRKPQPALRDAWFPYVLAFGLGRHADKWFKAFGGAATARGIASGGTIGTTSRTDAGGWTGFGGGGGFAGAGSSASFAAAVGGMAASVPSPSSSSSGGGRSGGGSSGGGGGGGW